jgi:hypothetical protein
MSLDVFKETPFWSHCSNSICDEGPEVAGIICAEPFAGGAEGLTGIASREDVHLSVKAGVWEGFNIRPDRCRVQVSRFHLCDQVRAGEGFDLAKSDCSQARDCSFESEINASISGT